MGYEHFIRKATCGKCNRQVAWSFKGSRRISNKWKCECGSTNYLKDLPEWPEVPRALYIGPDKLARFKVYALPPECPQEEWARSYSIRSFVYQASVKFHGCVYSCGVRGQVMDEAVYSDKCTIPDLGPFESGDWDCHLVGGWTTGQETCPLWKQVEQICQTDTERKFLHRYLGYVKDRQFPMLIPQTWVGIAERGRPDFVAFVPLQHWKYKWLAIQLDGAHPPNGASDDQDRDEYVKKHNYEVISLRPNQMGYFEEVRNLVEKIERWMKLAEGDLWQVAVEAKVTKTEDETDIPF